MTTTERDPESAVQIGTVVDPDGGSTRSARARATREDTAPDSAPAAVTRRDRDHGERGGWLDQLTPPEPWQHRPASLAAMSRYARRGGWTGPEGLARRAGVWYFRLFALPVTIVAHYAAWIVARPARAIVAVGLWAVLMQVRPLRAVADAVLPWPAWPLGGGR